MTGMMLFCSDIEIMVEAMKFATLGLVPHSPASCTWIGGPFATTPWPPQDSRPADRELLLSSTVIIRPACNAWFHTLKTPCILPPQCFVWVKTATVSEQRWLITFRLRWCLLGEVRAQQVLNIIYRKWRLQNVKYSGKSLSFRYVKVALFLTNS
jgi:hypothetical protein